MAQVDRWTLKILSLPLFDHAFAQAIAKTPLANLAFVSAMGVSSAAEFSAKVAEWAGSFDPAVVQVLLKDSGQLENFGRSQLEQRRCSLNQLRSSLVLVCVKTSP